MSSPAAQMHRLFGVPGSTPTQTGELLARVAAVHAALLDGASAGGGSGQPALAPILAFLRGPAAAADKRRLLCHPLLIEGLHGLAGSSAAVRSWHDCVAAPPAHRDAAPGGSAVCNQVDAAPLAAPPCLGNVALVCLLRADRAWQGKHTLCTDVMGRIGFPFSDWSLTLHADRDDFLAFQTIEVSLDDSVARWRLANSRDGPFLIMSRDDCLRMILDNADPVDRGQLHFPHGHLKPRLQCARPIGHSHIRYDAVGFRDFGTHAGMTGGLVERLLAALHRNAPAVYCDFQLFMHAVRGFEFPPSDYGIVGSFSDPTIPGVMNINIPYTSRHAPRLDPFCFTWFGHELAHTKDYLIETILYGEGRTLVLNPSERTDSIPRYGRPLAVRTVFQIPYVHLYEWALLTDFWDAGFRGLPWRVDGDVEAVGEDLAAEIEEAFALIDRWALLTPAGTAALGYFRELFELAQARWRLVRLCGVS